MRTSDSCKDSARSHVPSEHCRDPDLQLSKCSLLASASVAVGEGREFSKTDAMLRSSGLSARTCREQMHHDSGDAKDFGSTTSSNTGHDDCPCLEESGGETLSWSSCAGDELSPGEATSPSPGEATSPSPGEATSPEFGGADIFFSFFLFLLEMMFGAMLDASLHCVPTPPPSQHVMRVSFRVFPDTKIADETERQRTSTRSDCNELIGNVAREGTR